MRQAVPRARAFLHFVVNAGIDRLLGVRSSRVATFGELQYAIGNLAPYEPSSWMPLLRSLRALEAGPDDVLVDLGAGRGRVLLAAMREPFRRVIGVELSPELAQDARAALGRRRFWMRAGAAEVIVADAAEWAVPDDVTVIYMYCPFMGPVFAAAVDRILESLDRRPRRLRLVYLNPYEHNYLLSTERFVPVALFRRPRQPEGVLIEDVVIYEGLSAGREQVPVGPVGAWAGMRDTSDALRDIHPMIPGGPAAAGHD